MMILHRLFFVAFAIGLISDLAWGQNQVSNPGFDTDVAGWTTGSTTTIQWNSLDADSNPSSGSALVTNISTTADDAAGARQYITGITGGGYYRTSADILIPSGQPTTGQAGLLVQWYDQADCTGFVGLYSTPWVIDSTPDVWLPSSGTALAPASAQCARLRLSVWKNQDSGALDAHFDNVIFENDQVFADSFEDCTADIEGYPDADLDGFGDFLSPPSLFCGSVHYGYADNALDCDDTAGDIFPGQVELCDGVDNDCDGVVDEGCGDPGMPCDTPDQCGTGFCAPQGVCCDTACDGFNESCVGFETELPDGTCGIIIN